MEMLYGDIGRRLKYLALALCVIGCALSVFLGCMILFAPHTSFDEEVWLGIVIFIVGPIVSFISTWGLYGFGQLIENTDVLIQCNISSGRSLMQISRVVAQEQKSKRESQSVDFSVHSDDLAFVAFVDKATPEVLQKILATFDDHDSTLAHWKKEYVLSKCRHNDM